MSNLCPCGSKIEASACCQQIINGKRDAETALELMRSRYVAFTQANVDYLMRSHCAKRRPIREKMAIKKWAASVHWLQLIILKTEAGQAKDETGYVEFRALYMEDGKLQEIHENSKFIREKGKWVYC